MADSPRIEELKRRVQMDPASIAFAALAEEYRRAGRFDESVATCLAGLQRHPAYLSAHVTLGRAYLELGQYDEARQELEHVLRTAPENLAARRGLAEIYHRRGQLADALKQYQAALTVAPHDTELRETVAAITHELERPTSDGLLDLATGVDAFDLAIAASPGAPLAVSAVTTSTAPEAAPALAGLEEFLAAIVRARRARSATDRAPDTAAIRR